MEERMVYSTLTSILTIPYKGLAQSTGLPIPKQRIFLEMPVGLGCDMSNFTDNGNSTNPGRHQFSKLQMHLDGIQ